jgi:hypothetical protein
MQSAKVRRIACAFLGRLSGTLPAAIHVSLFRHTLIDGAAFDLLQIDPWEIAHSQSEKIPGNYKEREVLPPNFSVVHKPWGMGEIQKDVRVSVRCFSQ